MKIYIFPLIFCTALIFAFGIIMVFNTTSAQVLEGSIHIDAYESLYKQIGFGIFSIIIGFIIWHLGYHNVIRLSPAILLLTCILLVLVFIPKIGLTLNGAKRWINVFGFSFQPSELFKYVLPIHFIYYVGSLKKKIDFKSFIKILSLYIIPCVLIFLEPDNGSCLLIVFTFILLFFLYRIKFMYWVIPLLIVMSLGIVFAANMPYVKERLKIYVNPESDIYGKGHQPYQAKIAAGSGYIFGKGLGNSIQKHNYLPEARSDYLAAIFAEEFGFVGIFFLILAYMTIAFFGFYIAFHAADREGAYLATMITFLICFQAFFNLGVVSGLLPSKGIALPFFSQGGTSLLVNISALVLLLNISYAKKC